MKAKGISQAARESGCCEATLRRLEIRKVVRPNRDACGRRRFGDDDIEAARSYLEIVRSRPRRRAADVES